MLVEEGGRSGSLGILVGGGKWEYNNVGLGLREKWESWDIGWGRNGNIAMLVVEGRETWESGILVGGRSGNIAMLVEEGREKWEYSNVG